MIFFNPQGDCYEVFTTCRTISSGCGVYANSCFGALDQSKLKLADTAEVTRAAALAKPMNEVIVPGLVLLLMDAQLICQVVQAQEHLRQMK